MSIDSASFTSSSADKQTTYGKGIANNKVFLILFIVLVNCKNSRKITTEVSTLKIMPLSMVVYLISFASSPRVGVYC